MPVSSFPSFLSAHALGHMCFILAKQMQLESHSEKAYRLRLPSFASNADGMLYFYKSCHWEVGYKSLFLESRCAYDCFDKKFGRSDCMWFQSQIIKDQVTSTLFTGDFVLESIVPTEHSLLAMSIHEPKMWMKPSQTLQNSPSTSWIPPSQCHSWHVEQNC